MFNGLHIRTTNMTTGINWLSLLVISLVIFDYLLVTADVPTSFLSDLPPTKVSNVPIVQPSYGPVAIGSGPNMLPTSQPSYGPSAVRNADSASYGPRSSPSHVASTSENIQPAAMPRRTTYGPASVRAAASIRDTGVVFDFSRRDINFPQYLNSELVQHHLLLLLENTNN